MQPLIGVPGLVIGSAVHAPSHRPTETDPPTPPATARRHHHSLKAQQRAITPSASAPPTSHMSTHLGLPPRGHGDTVGFSFEVSGDA